MDEHQQSILLAQLEPWLGGRSFTSYREEFDELGYLVFERVLGGDRIAALRDALQPYLDKQLTGRNDFEGLKSNRVYGLLAKSSAFADLAIHPLALAFAEAELGESCLLSACLAINLHPGESVQPWHHDDAHIAIPRPHLACGLSAFWTLDDTTQENGATEVLPGSHLWSSEQVPGALQETDFERQENDAGSEHSLVDPGANENAVKVTMPAGSLMIAKGTLWHRGGANQSTNSRMIVTPQYCVGWVRQLENMCLAVPKEKLEALPERAQELIGYSIHPPFMGYVDGVHPRNHHG